MAPVSSRSMNRGVRLLLGLAVATTLAGCGVGSMEAQHSTSAPEQTTVSATVAKPEMLSKEAPADEDVDRFTAFRSPSSNIGCYLKADYVRCDIDERNWKPPPRPADCEWDYGQGIKLVAGRQRRVHLRRGHRTRARRRSPALWRVDNGRAAAMRQCSVGHHMSGYRDGQGLLDFTRRVSPVLSPLVALDTTAVAGICAATLWWTIVVLRDGRRTRCGARM